MYQIKNEKGYLSSHNVTLYKTEMKYYTKQTPLYDTLDAHKDSKHLYISHHITNRPPVSSLNREINNTPKTRNKK